MTREEVIELSNSYKTNEEYNKLKEYFSQIEHTASNKHTIVFSTPSWTGTSYFRLMEPLLAMYRATDEFNLIFCELQVNQGRQVSGMAPVHADLADLVVLHRAHELHDLFHSAYNAWPLSKVKPFLIHNVDDIEYKLPSSHPLYAMWVEGGRREQSMRSLRTCDAVEITTHKMKQTMQPHNNNVVITRNRFNWRLPQWNLPKHQSITAFIKNKEEAEKWEIPEDWNGTDKIVIGWAGLTSHFEDIVKMKPILKAIYNKYPNTCFVLAGMSLGDTVYDMKRDPKTGKSSVEEKKITDPEQMYRARVGRLFSDFAPDRLRIFDALPIEQYGWFNSQFDIALAFMEHNMFSEKKSEIKIVEAMRYASIPVFSSYGGYQDVVDDWKKSKLFSTEEISRMACRGEFTTNEWVENLSYWIDRYGTEEHQSVATRLKEYADTKYDIDLNIHEQLHMYKQNIENNISNKEEAILNLKMQYD